ncbi:hypothetical protein AX16_007681 [Volvariella volvacea WC 439]|nr:hypothetical protein AX16_007681 [Volvariella volvacea WC 439]
MSTSRRSDPKSPVQKAGDAQDPIPDYRTPPRPRTLDEVRAEVAHSIASRLICKYTTIESEPEMLDDPQEEQFINERVEFKIGVTSISTNTQDPGFLHKIAAEVDDYARNKRVNFNYLFIVANTALSSQSLLICSSSYKVLQRAILLTGPKFIGRIEEDHFQGRTWSARIQDLGINSYDELALEDVAKKSASKSITDYTSPPPGSRGIDEILSATRATLQRVTPQQAYEELRTHLSGAPTFLVDIRPVAQRQVEGMIRGSLIIERNVLEWRFDPRSDARLAIADRYDLRVIVFCQEGYTSSLAAHSLQQLGLLNATDMIGGYRAWKEAGLPAEVPPPPSPRSTTASYFSEPSEY